MRVCFRVALLVTTPNKGGFVEDEVSRAEHQQGHKDIFFKTLLTICLIMIALGCTNNHLKKQKIIQQPLSSKATSHHICDNLDSAFKYKDSVEYLYLSDSDIWHASYKSLPDSLYKLSRLSSIDLIGLKDFDYSKAFEKFSKLRSLKKLRINDSNISFLPGNIGLLQNLTNFELDCEGAKLTLSSKLFTLRNLNALGLNDMVTAISDSLALLQSLTDLDLNIIGEKNLPNAIFKLKNLEYLRIGWDIEDIPNIIKSLTRLKIIYCDGSAFANLEFDYLNKYHHYNKVLNINKLLPNCKIQLSPSFK